MPRAYRRRRFRRRSTRYRRRRSGRKINNRPWGKQRSVSAIPRCVYARPEGREKCYKLTYSVYAHEPVQFFQSEDTYTQNDPTGYAFSPFSIENPWIHDIAYDGRETSIGIQERMSSYKNWKLVRDRFDEWQPLWVKYDIAVTPIKVSSVYDPPRIGVFITAKDTNGVISLPEFQNGNYTHYQSQTLDAWPGGKVKTACRSLSASRTTHWRGTILFRDFKQTGAAADIAKTWFTWTDIVYPIPLIFLWFVDPTGAYVGGIGQRYFRVHINFTLGFRARSLAEKDPLYYPAPEP